MISQDARFYDVWLDCLKQVSVRQKIEMVKTYGSSRAIYEGSGLCRDSGQVGRILEQMQHKKIRAISYLEPEYPESLRWLSDPPWMLYCRGNVDCLQSQGIAVVGARKSTEYGRWAAYELGRKLSAAGVTIISGMACGVDAAAHRGALAGGGEGMGSTVAVLGCGVDICYPKINQQLMEEILQKGVVVSELPPGTGPKPYFFPLRNRIISGLSRCVVVAEAGLQSGSLITAELAAEQGREVYAVPGNINRPSSIGTNKLIKDGAIPLVVLDDLLAELGIIDENFTESIQNLLGIDEKKIYNEILVQGEITADQLSQRIGIPPARINAMVTVLEMKGIVHTALGKIFIAKL